MPTLFVDSHHSDAERRRRLYSGDIYMYSPRPATAALCDFARGMVEEAFAPLDPQQAQHELPVERFVEIVAPLKPRFIHHPRTLELLRALLVALGCELGETYFDVPRMRVSTSDDYLSAGVAYVLHPHRDVWYASPLCQLNWWLPLYPFEAESSFAFHPRYWNEAVPNSSCEYNHYDWNLNGRKNASAEVKADTRKQPRPTAPLDLQPEVRVVCPPGGLILFSGAHLHSTVPNTSGRTRFSIDFRTANLNELAARGGAPNLDTAPTGTTLYELRQAGDLSPVPPEILALYEPNPPSEGLVFRPPEAATASEPAASPAPAAAGRSAHG